MNEHVPSRPPKSAADPSDTRATPVDPAEQAAALARAVAEASVELAAWATVAGPGAAELVAAAEASVAAGGPTATDIIRWRKKHDPETVRAAIELARGRQSLAGRRSDAAELLSDRAGAEQATDAGTAAWKGRHLGACGFRTVVDIGCGIGGDAMGLAIDPRIEAIELVDRDPRRIAMAAHNTELAARARPAGAPELTISRRLADVSMVSEPAADPAAAADDRVVLIDPGRRDEATGDRRHDPSAAEPGPETVARIIAGAGHMALKASPGADPDELPPPAGDGRGRTVEYIAVRRQLVQAVGWYGRAATSGVPVRATVLPDGRSVEGTPDTSMDPAIAAPADPESLLTTPPAFLHVPHPVAERSRLVSQAWRDNATAGRPPQTLAAGLGLLVSDRVGPRPWFESWAIREVHPWRLAPIRQRLRELDTGIVTVRTRGGAVDPDVVARQLRGRGERPHTIFVLRLGVRMVTFMVDPTDAAI